jgi:hypothetical protein
MIVLPIQAELAKPFIMDLHYAHRMPCIQYAFGLIDDDNIIGVCTYGQPASPWLYQGVAGEENRSKVIELNRLALLPKYNGGNHASMLVGRSLRLLPKGLFIVSYADFGGQGHVGYVYQATNWIYTGLTKERTDIYSESGHSRHGCGDSTKRQNRTAKHRYIYLTGDKKKQMEQLRYQEEPYPKGENVKYKTVEDVPTQMLLPIF